MQPVRKIAGELYDPAGPDGIWWLGNAGFAFRFAEEYVFIDPAVTEEAHDWDRKHDFPLPAEDFRRADFVCYSHEHCDHMDRGLFPRLMELNTTIVAPLYCKPFITERDVPEDQIRPAKVGGVFEGERYSIEIIRSRHGGGGKMYYKTDMDQDDVTCGFLIRTAYGNIFHPGDSFYLDEFQELDVDYLLLPINDTNLNVGFAAQLANELQPRAIIPCHYGMWGPMKHWMGGHPAEFITALAVRGYPMPLTDIHILRPGGKLVLTRSN
jgi:L-ascorbate metabolism protein UlaG (beta-lactamase superfamily)